MRGVKQVTKIKHVCDKAEEIAVMKEKIDEIHTKLLGKEEGKGLLSKWDRLEGQMSVWKFLAASGVMMGVFNLLRGFIGK